MVLDNEGETPLAERNNVRVEYDLMNNLGFNLCVASWSLVVVLVMYFRVEGYCSMKSDRTGTRTQTPLELHQMLYH